MHIAKQHDLATLKHKGTLSAPWLLQWRHFPTCRRTLLPIQNSQWNGFFNDSDTHTHKHRNMNKKKNERFLRKREKEKKRPRRENGNCSINITSIVNLKQCSYFAFAINKISCSIFGCAMCYRIKCGKCMLCA